MQDVLLAIYNFSELKSLANNAKIRSSLKFLLVRYAFFFNHCNTCNVLQPSSSFPKNGIVGNKNTNLDSYTTEIRIEIYVVMEIGQKRDRDMFRQSPKFGRCSLKTRGIQSVFQGSEFILRLTKLFTE